MVIRFFTLVLLCTFSNCLLFANIPHASIIGWQPGSYGNCPGIGHQRPALPIWVRIDFDQSVTEEFACTFFQFLNKSLNPSSRVNSRKAIKHKLGGFSITIQPTFSKNDLQYLIDQANRYFDPDYKTPQELAIIREEKKIQEQIVAKIAAEQALKKRLEEERLRKKEEQKDSEERRLKALAQAAENARLLAIAQEQYRLQQEEHQKQIEQKEAQKEVSYPEYSVLKLPKNFYIFGKYKVLNNSGKIVGCVSNRPPLHRPGRTFCIIGNEDKFEDAQAAYWEKSKGVVVIDQAEHNSIAKAINDLGLILVAQYKSNQSRQALLWDTKKNTVLSGPYGDPYFINNANSALIDRSQKNNPFDNTKRTTIWYPKDNSIVYRDCFYPYMTDDGELHQNGLMNNRGSLLRAGGPEMSLKCGSKDYLLLCDQIIDAALNDSDQVAALINVQWGSKTYKAIKILEKNGNSIRTKTIKELGVAGSITIIGFNILKQVLIKTNDDYILLTPNF